MPKLRLGAVLLTISVVALAAACGNRERRESHRLDAWIGKKERKLVLAAGAPDAIHELQDGGRILTWRRSHIERQGGEIVTETETRMVDGQTVILPVTRQEPTFEFHYECTASFEVDAKGIVRGHEIRGNDCDRFLE